MVKVECPYCKKPFYRLTPSHLKRHGKTVAQCRKDFPEILKYYFMTGRGTSPKMPPITEKERQERDYRRILITRAIKRRHEKMVKKL